MVAKHSGKRRRKQAARPSPPHKQQASEDTAAADSSVRSSSYAPRPNAAPRTDRVARIRSDFWTGLILTAVLILASAFFVRTKTGHALELWSFNYLSSWLHSSAPALVVGDITDLPMISVAQGEPVTSRDQLREIVNALARCQPTSIGIDIDFSREQDQWLHPSDPDFLEFCRTLRDPGGSPIPVFVGVDRGLDRHPDQWLGEDRFKALAVNIRLPKDHSKVLAWYRAPGVAEALPAMGAALATNVVRDLHRLQRFPSLLASATVDDHAEESEFEMAQFFVDLSPLRELRDHRVVLRDGASVDLNAHRFHDKIVLLAKVGSEEQFPLPVEMGGGSYAGGYFHACAANTIVEQPLLRLQPLAETGLDLGLSLFVLAAVAWMRLRYHRVSDRDAPVRSLELSFTLIAVALVLICGVVWISAFRIVWLGFLVVAAGLLVHLVVGRLMHGWAHTGQAHPESRSTRMTT